MASKSSRPKIVLPIISFAFCFERERIFQHVDVSSVDEAQDREHCPYRQCNREECVDEHGECPGLDIGVKTAVRVELPRSDQQASRSFQAAGAVTVTGGKSHYRRCGVCSEQSGGHTRSQNT